MINNSKKTITPVNSKGFTLIELIVTMSVIGIMLAIAAPSFTEMIQSNRLATSVNELSGSINSARSEAVKREGRVVICKSANASACVTTGTWDQGWIIFVDTDNSSTREVGEALIRVHEAIGGNVVMTGAGNVANFISYMSEGRAQLTTGLSQTGNITACSNGKQRVVQVTFTGRLQLSGGTC